MLPMTPHTTPNSQISHRGEGKEESEKNLPTRTGTVNWEMVSVGKQYWVLGMKAVPQANLGFRMKNYMRTP